MLRLAVLSGLALPTAVASGCTAQPDKRELVCSIARQGGWIRAPSTFQPEGVRTRRLTPDDRARVGDPSFWRQLSLPEQFVRDPIAFCGSAARRDVADVRLSEDGSWGRVVFRERDREETCLARRDGGVWRERECDITMIADPV